MRGIRGCGSLGPGMKCEGQYYMRGIRGCGSLGPVQTGHGV